MQVKKMNAADLASLLRGEIMQGAIALHEKLPAEREMAENYGVSRGTVREALLILMETDLVNVKKRKRHLCYFQSQGTPTQHHPNCKST